MSGILLAHRDRSLASRIALSSLLQFLKKSRRIFSSLIFAVPSMPCSVIDARHPEIDGKENKNTGKRILSRKLKI